MYQSLCYHVVVDSITHSLSIDTQNEQLELREEAVFLERQLELLRLQRVMQLRSASVAQWEERAVTARHYRRQVEAVNEQLRSAVYLHSHFMRGLHPVFSSSPLVNDVSLQLLVLNAVRFL